MTLCPPDEHCFRPRFGLDKWWKQKWPFYCKKCYAIVRFSRKVEGYYIRDLSDGETLILEAHER